MNNCSGNVLLDRMSGANVYLVPNESLSGGLSARIDTLIKRLWYVLLNNHFLPKQGGQILQFLFILL